MAEPTDQRPTPDPTVLTTEQLERAVANLKDLLQTEVSGLEQVIDERFDSVKIQFGLIERQRVEQKTDTRTAVDAALAAAKEAVGKSEVSTKEQLTAMRAETTAAIKTVTEALGDLKERIVAMESLKQGGVEQRQAQREGVSTTTQLTAAVIAIITVLFLIYTATQNGSAPGTDLIPFTPPTKGTE